MPKITGYFYDTTLNICVNLSAKVFFANKENEIKYDK